MAIRTRAWSSSVGDPPGVRRKVGLPDEWDHEFCAALVLVHSCPKRPTATASPGAVCERNAEEEHEKHGPDRPQEGQSEKSTRRLHTSGALHRHRGRPGSADGLSNLACALVLIPSNAQSTASREYECHPQAVQRQSNDRGDVRGRAGISPGESTGSRSGTPSASPAT
jgi:hypothetical protein